LPLFDAEHRHLLEILCPKDHEPISAVLQNLGRFMEDKISPHSLRFDEGKESIAGPRKALLSNGICQIPFPEKYGGIGLPFTAYASAMELAGSADASIALSVAIHNTVSEGIFHFGSEDQKSNYLPKIIAGEKLASFGLTEPASGSDSKAMTTTAEREGKDYVLNGSKMFITNAGEADVYFIFARSEKGPSCFLVDAPNPGMKFGEDLKKLGMRGSRTSEIVFSDCRIRKENLVGKEGEGFEYAKAMLNASRVVMGSLNVGIARVALDKSISYSKQRRAFGQSISEFQLIREKIADMKTGITAGRLLCLYAARLKDRGADFSSEASQAKVFATETAVGVCDSAIQIHGGLGYTSDDVHRLWRDARLLTIGEGTSEVLRMLIARRELAKSV
jgi:alkylation response protein AidB-like acyl-CoA dehydrogenase